MSQRRWSGNQLKALESVLLGAAYADGDLAREESEAIDLVVEALSGDEDLGFELFLHRSTFDPATFQLEQACAELDLKTPQERRFVLKLVARITDSDKVHDVDESAYIVQVARALGAAWQEYADLVVEVVDDGQPGGPPPMPHPKKRVPPPPPPKK